MEKVRTNYSSDVKEALKKTLSIHGTFLESATYFKPEDKPDYISTLTVYLRMLDSEADPESVKSELPSNLSHDGRVFDLSGSGIVKSPVNNSRIIHATYTTNLRGPGGI